MRILWQTEHYPDSRKGGGSVSNTTHIVRTLRQMGHEVVILARQEEDNQKAQNLIELPPVIPFVPPNLPRRLWSLWPVLEARALRYALLTVAGDYDAFVCHDAAYGLAFKHLGPEKPVIFRIAGAAKIHDSCVPPRRTNGESSVSALKRRAWSRF